MITPEVKRPDDPVERALGRVLVVFLLGAGFSIVVEQSAAILAGLIWIVALAWRRTRPSLPLVWPGIAFLAAALVASVAALAPAPSFGQLRSEWVPFLLFMVVANLPVRGWFAAVRIDVMAVVAALTAIVGLAQAVRYGTSFRICGTLDQYMTYSGILVLLGLPLLGSLLFSEPRVGTGRRIGRVIVLLLLSMALVLTQTRGAWLGAFAGIAVLVALWRAAWLTAVPLLAVVALLLAPPATRERVVDLVALRDVTATERVYMWRATADIVRDHPLTGVGLDNYWLVIEDYRLPDDPWIETHVLKHAHNNAFMIAAERGILGLGAWVAFWVAWLWAIGRTWWRLPADAHHARGVVASSIAAVVAFHVAGLTEYTWGDTEVAYLAAFLMGTGLAYARDARLDA